MRDIRTARFWLVLFIAGLVVSGLTAFPLETELRLASRLLDGWLGTVTPDGVVLWVDRVHAGLRETNDRYPFIAYGTDWLAFAHLVIAVAFWGPLRDPVRNIWVIHFGVIACLAIVPLALIAGPLRGIPWEWRLIDISFGVVGVIPLLLALRAIHRVEASPRAVPAER
ncbi:hypothetical protein DFJ67_7766 [Asanoa ferruginea]|uniref:Uncharacterized protein n=1 Tax=Asanoa ferruginea TaxID=53367 RepID=A0A3D9ZXE6_9ACTN|nr:hypothetical protein [Asanoa ferruginea]REG01680.1 hypothetical protein DFJ67_7766 [Asanoa ferruginea]GIF51691.1 hypothetical protein Afe04nite_62300 [Asanoa ferruginea]